MALQALLNHPLAQQLRQSHKPLPQKQIKGRTIYLSTPLGYHRVFANTPEKISPINLPSRTPTTYGGMMALQTGLHHPLAQQLQQSENPPPQEQIECLALHPAPSLRSPLPNFPPRQKLTLERKSPAGPLPHLPLRRKRSESRLSKSLNAPSPNPLQSQPVNTQTMGWPSRPRPLCPVRLLQLFLLLPRHR